MQRWFSLTKMISILLFAYLQVREYGYFQLSARRLAMCLSVASASTPGRPYTEATKGVKCRRSLRQAWRYFSFFLTISGLQALLGGFGLVGDGVSIHDTHVVNTIHTLCP